MIDAIRAQDRHFSDFGWLKTYWLFSFSNYFDPHNIQFGALRVFNDDIVEPGTGFPTHPHVATVCENMAKLYRQIGKEGEAEKLEARARRIRSSQ